MKWFFSRISFFTFEECHAPFFSRSNRTRFFSLSSTRVFFFFSSSIHIYLHMTDFTVWSTLSIHIFAIQKASVKSIYFVWKPRCVCDKSYFTLWVYWIQWCVQCWPPARRFLLHHNHLSTVLSDWYSTSNKKHNFSQRTIFF